MAVQSKKSTNRRDNAATTANQDGNHSTNPTTDEVIGSFADSIAWFLSRPAALYKWLTAARGGQRIILGGLTIYFFLCTCESYWQALSVGENFAKTGKFAFEHQDRPSFMPKPFSPSTGSLSNIGIAIADPGFYVTAGISLVILGIQANLQRGKKSVKQAQKDYEAVKQFKVGEVTKDHIDLVKHEAQAYKEAGTHKQRSIATVVFVSYVIDIIANAAPYGKFFTAGAGGFISSAAWVWACVFGAENFLNLWQANEDAIQSQNDSKRFPKILKFPRGNERTQEEHTA